MNPKHQIFLSEVLRHGDANRAYKAAYPDASGESLRVAANRLLHNPGMLKCINEFYGSIRDYLAQDIIARRENQLHTVRKKRAVLKAIYTKEMETIKTITSKVYEVRDIIIEPTNTEILKAIQLDNTLADKEEELMGYEIPAIIHFNEPENEIEKAQEFVTNRNNGGGEVMISIDVPDIEEDFDPERFFKETDELTTSDLTINPEAVTIEDEPETVENVTERDISPRGESLNPKNPGSDTGTVTIEDKPEVIEIVTERNSFAKETNESMQPSSMYGAPSGNRGKRGNFLNRLKHKQKEKLMVA